MFVIRRIGGSGDFIGSYEVCTRFYEFFCYFDKEHQFTPDEGKAMKYDIKEEAEDVCPAGCEVVEFGTTP